MFNLRVILALAAFAFSAGASLAAPPSKAEAGHALAQQYCAGCHAIGPDIKNGWTDAPDFAAIANKPGTTVQTLTAFIQKPHMHMLNTGRPPNEAADLAAYIVTLRHR